MKNLLFKSNIINRWRISKILINVLNKWSLEYDYQLTKVPSQDRTNFNKSYFNKSKITDSTVFDYKEIKFNMITCPAGGIINLDATWGSQEIKEPFMLGETEVTQELFEAVMGFNYSEIKESNKNPVENVTWYDCLEFCNRLSSFFGLSYCYLLSNKIYSTTTDDRTRDVPFPLSIEKAEITFIEGANGFRLPKEWEWQIAAMAGTNNKYAGANDGESVKRVAWVKENSNQKTHPVAQKLPNEWGFYDMTGNIDEWCENALKFDRNNAISDNRVDRGGSWFNYSTNLHTAVRSYDPASFRNVNLGFRIAKSI